MKKLYLVPLLLFLGTVTFHPQIGLARELAGRSGSQIVRLTTRLIQGGEYVQVYEIIPFFQNNYTHDSLSGTLTFQRNDGVQVGIKVGDQRVVIGNTIMHTGMIPHRENGRIYIPFYVVDTYLFPNVRFQESTGLSSSPTPVPQHTVTKAATPLRYIFTYPTKTIPDRQTRPLRTPASTQPFFKPTPFPNQKTVQPQMPSAPSAVIVLDPGNDDEHPGAIGPNGLRESNLTLSICKNMSNELSRNYEVILTRKGNETIGNQARIEIANQSQGSIFLSIHCGGLSTDNVSRGAVYFMNERLDYKHAQENPSFPTSNLLPWNNAYQRYMGESYQLAQAVNRQLAIFYENTGLVKLDSNPRPGRFAILRGLTMPGVVVELGNIHHTDTANYLGSGINQKDLAQYLSVAVEEFIHKRAGVKGF